MRIREPKTTALIFASGKLVRALRTLGGCACPVVCPDTPPRCAPRCAPAQRQNRWQGWRHASTSRSSRSWASPHSSRCASLVSRDSCGRLTHPTTLPLQDFTVQNIVASADVKFPIKLEGLAFAHAMFANYEPELFPGLIYRMKQPKVVLLIFVSGKVVLTGAKVRRHRLLIASRMQVWGSPSLPPPCGRHETTCTPPSRASTPC